MLLQEPRRAAARRSQARLAGGDRRRRRPLHQRRRLVQHQALLAHARRARAITDARRARGSTCASTTGADLDRGSAGRARRRRRRRRRRRHRGRGHRQALPGARLRPPSAAALQRDELVERVAAANPRTIVVLETAGPVLTPWRDQVAGDRRGLVPRRGRRRRRSRGCCSATSTRAAGCPPPSRAARRDLPTAGSARRYPGVDNVVALQRGRAGRLPLVRPARDQARLPVRLRPLLHPLRASATCACGATPAASAPRVTIDVANTGARTGIAVPQLYLGLPGAPGRIQPPRQLKGFRQRQAARRRRPGA